RGAGWPEPAKRCERPQSLSASAAGRRRVSISASTSEAADRRAPGVMALSCADSAALARLAPTAMKFSVRPRGSGDPGAKHASVSKSGSPHPRGRTESEDGACALYEKLMPAAHRDHGE